MSIIDREECRRGLGLNAALADETDGVASVTGEKGGSQQIFSRPRSLLAWAVASIPPFHHSTSSAHRIPQGEERLVVRGGNHIRASEQASKQALFRLFRFPLGWRSLYPFFG